MRSRLRIDSSKGLRYFASLGQVWSGVGRPSGPHDRLVNGPEVMSPDASGPLSSSRSAAIQRPRPRVIFPPLDAGFGGDTCGTAVPQTSRRASLDALGQTLPETGALLWVLTGRSDTGAIAAQQCTIARNRRSRGKSSTCISRCRMRLGTILDALRDQPPGSVTSAIFKARRLVRATPTSPAKARAETHVHSHSPPRAPTGAQLANKLRVHRLAPRAGYADTCVWTHSERHPCPPAVVARCA